MTPDARQRLVKMLVDEEDYRQFPYLDTQQKLTIGIGRNLTDVGISLDEALYLCKEDIAANENKLMRYLQFYKTLSDNRQIALNDMCYNLGIKGFLGFRKMMMALESGDYERAADEMLQSNWAKQVGKRVQKLAMIMRRGEI